MIYGTSSGPSVGYSARVTRYSSTAVVCTMFGDCTNTWLNRVDRLASGFVLYDAKRCSRMRTVQWLIFMVTVNLPRAWTAPDAGAAASACSVVNSGAFIHWFNANDWTSCKNKINFPPKIPKLFLETSGKYGVSSLISMKRKKQAN